MQIEIL